MNAKVPAKCCLNRLDAANEHFKVPNEEVIATHEELRACNKYLAAQNKQLEARVRELEKAHPACTEPTAQGLAEKLRMLSLALATTEMRERRSLERDLHDDLGQLLAVIALKMTAIEKFKLPKSIKGALNLKTAVQ